MSSSQNLQYSFDDIEPLPLVIERNPVSTILYTDEFKEVMGIFRALQEREEYSERALYMTEKVIELIAAHYTVWQYRYGLIVKLGKDIHEELDWVEQIALDNTKNYQIWGYRQLLLKQSGEKNMRRELPLLEMMLSEDSKNYHVWSYRKWCVQWCEDWSYELPFVAKMVGDDVYNNSAWCHRFFVVSHELSDGVLEREIKYTQEQIALAPKNESAWNYLVGVLEKAGKPLSHIQEFVSQYAQLDGEVKSMPALEVLTKIYKDSDPVLALKGYELMGSKYDTMRVKYWEYQRSLIQ